MKRIAGLALLFFVTSTGLALAQAQLVRQCVGSNPNCVPVSVAAPLPVTGSFTPSGTQDINIKQIQGAVPSLTNPLWVFPATGATFPVSLTSTTITGNTVVVGPTADGSPATTAPVLMGGTVDGSASGNVGVAKVDAAGLAYNAITNWGGGALGAMANYGTSPGAVLAPGVNAFVTNTVTVTGTVTPSNPVGLTPTDRTVTSATGASQTMMAANASRHSLSIVNTGNANCGVNPTGGTAAIGGAGTLTLAPLGSYTPRIPTVSAVTVICTAAQPIYGDEN